MNKRTEGIVLKSFPYGEADLIVTFLTPGLGIVPSFARGARKIKSRFGSSLEPFTYSIVSFMGREGASMPRLTQADIQIPFQGLREDLGCFTGLSELAEITIGLMPEGQPNPEVFGLLKDVLGLMEDRCDTLYALLYKARLLALKGYAPQLSACGRCGAEALGFFASQGSLLCGRCASETGHNGQAITLSQGAQKLFRAVSAWDIKKAPRLRASDRMLGELSSAIDAHIGHVLSKPLKSKGALTR